MPARSGRELDELDSTMSRSSAARASTGARARLRATSCGSAAREVRLSETALLGRLRALADPGLEPDTSPTTRLFREPPFVVLEEGERCWSQGSWAGSGRCAGTTPGCARPRSSADGRERGTARVVFAHWAQDASPAGSARARLEAGAADRRPGEDRRGGGAADRAHLRAARRQRRASAPAWSRRARRTQRPLTVRRPAAGAARCGGFATIAQRRLARASNVT